MKLSLEILYTSIKDDGLSYGENRTCLATLVFEIYRKQTIVGMWLINFVTHCTVGRKIIHPPSRALFFLSFLLYGNQLRSFY